jgi:hypothetical protein
MPALLADENAEGHLDLLLAYCREPAWRAVWESLGVAAHRSEDLGLDRQTPDDALWHFCQANGLLLVTANRNAEDPHSLQVTIAEAGTPDSLPFSPWPTPTASTPTGPIAAVRRSD